MKKLDLLKADIYAGGRKRIFIGLLFASCILVCLLFLALLILPWMGEGAHYLRYVSLGAGVAGICLLAWLCAILIFNIYTGRHIPGITGVRHMLIRLFLPLMEIAGKILGIDKTIVRRSFIKVNNEFVLNNIREVPPEKLLLLLPHCIQASVCPRRLTYSIDNCAKCGKCQIGELANLSRMYGFQIAVATGGTIARRIVVEKRPSCIIAVACERDLASGIQDSYPVPVFGVLNIRPHGPCRDTRVPQNTLRLAIQHFTGISH